MIGESPYIFSSAFTKIYSQLNKSTYSTLLRLYYRDGCCQSEDNSVKFYYKIRGRDLTDIDLSLKEAYQVINDSWYGAIIYIDVSRPDSFVFTDIILCEE